MSIELLPAVFTVTAEPWVDDAACLGCDPDLFHPEQGQTSTAAAARAVCSSCPVTGDCLAYALRTRVEAGIWGGTTPGEREALTRTDEPRPISHGSEGGYRTHRRRGQDACTQCADAMRLARREREARAS